MYYLLPCNKNFKKAMYKNLDVLQIIHRLEEVTVYTYTTIK